MKEFNKWWGNSIINFEEYKLAERVWKAALERVLKHTKRTNKGRVGIMDWIEEELNEKN